ncbi:MAG: hypothetical protein AAGK32_15515, partial [Actinomycetota bacterium]
PVDVGAEILGRVAADMLAEISDRFLAVDGVERVVWTTRFPVDKDPFVLALREGGNNALALLDGHPGVSVIDTAMPPPDTDGPAVDVSGRQLYVGGSDQVHLTSFGGWRAARNVTEALGCDEGCLSIPDVQRIVEPGASPWSGEDGTGSIGAALDWVATYELMDGVSTEPPTFDAASDMTRAQLARLVYRLAGSPDVSTLPGHGLEDVPPWVDDAVTWLAADPDEDGRFEPIWSVEGAEFEPDRPVSRVEAARVLHRFAGQPDHEPSPSPEFADVADADAAAVAWATVDRRGPGNDEPLLEVDGDDFDPDGSMARAEVARLVHRMAGTEGAWRVGSQVPWTMGDALTWAFRWPAD